MLGGGPGGYVAAIRAAQLGLSVTLVEEADLGGICLNWGCIPSKALLRNAEVLRLVSDAGRFGIQTGPVTADFDAAITRSRAVVAQLVQGVGFLMRKNGIEVVRGRGRLTSEQSMTVGPSAQTVVASQIVIATGARSRSLPSLPIDGETVVTSRQALEQGRLPATCLIVGGGAIGAEFAYVYRAYGVAVTIVEALPRLLPAEDPDISRELTRQFERQGIAVRPGTTVQGAERTGGGVRVLLGDGSAMEVERVLVATGVEPNVSDIGLETVGVALDRGAIRVDAQMRTSVPGVFAIGDVVGPPLLAHVASAQGVVAVETAAGRQVAALDYAQMPRCTYCQPQVASVGWTEEEARAGGRAVRVGKFPFSASGKAIAMGETAGFIKTVVDAESGALLGTHAIGSEVTELLPEMVMAAWAGVRPDQFEALVHAHPTLSEGLKEAALAAQGLAIHI